MFESVKEQLSNMQTQASEQCGAYSIHDEDSKLETNHALVKMMMDKKH